MRIAQIALEGSGAWPDFRAKTINDGLSVFYGPSNTGKTTVAEFLAHVLYGKAAESTNGSWRRHGLPEGEIIVIDRSGKYRLRRYTDVPPPGRLTISSLDSTTVAADDLRQLLGNVSPEILPDLYAIDFARISRQAWLPSREFAKAFHATIGARDLIEEERPASHVARDRWEWNYRNPGRVEELLDRRERLTRDLEDRITNERRHIHQWDSRLRDIDALLREQDEQTEQYRRRLDDIENALDELNGRLRPGHVDELVEREYRKRIPADLDQQLSDVEREIERLRSQMAEFTRREHTVNGQLSKLGPAADTVEGQSFGRASIASADSAAFAGVVSDLVAEMSTELGPLANATSAACVCREARTRLLPLCEALEDQLSTLRASIEGHDRAAHYYDWDVERKHLQRVQLELNQQLGHLQQRREKLLRYQRPLLAVREESDHWRLRRRELTEERDRLLAAVARCDLKSEELVRERAVLVRDRSTALDGLPIEQIRGELQAIQSELESLLIPAPAVPPRVRQAPTRASDYVAQLSAGRLVELRRESRTGSAYAVTKSGDRLFVESLGKRDRVLVHLSMVLAILAEHAREGVRLPLILDEPFTQLSELERDAVATVLDQFANSGHQVLLFTGQPSAASRFRELRVDVHEMVEVQRNSGPIDVRPGIANVEIEPRPEPTVRDGDEGCLYQLTSPISMFPVIGRSTEQRLIPLGIRRVADLLDADPAALAASLDRDDVTTDVVAYWQTLLTLMCYTPGVALDDAQVLCDSGAMIRSPEDLADADLAALERQMRSYLSSDRGQSWREHGYVFDHRQLDTWQRGARRNRHRWRSSPYFHRSSVWQRKGRSSHRGSDVRTSRDTQSRSTGTQQDRTSDGRDTRERTAREATAPRTELRFHLDPSSDIEAAPSIGPKTAARFYDLGIRKVHQFLASDAVEMAERIDARHITATAIATWQQQARLMCAVPELRGHDAQILVGCDLADPEEIAALTPQALLGRIDPFCDSKEGKRMIRSGKRPDLAEVTDWIEWCGHRRIVQVA